MGANLNGFSLGETYAVTEGRVIGHIAPLLFHGKPIGLYCPDNGNYQALDGYSEQKLLDAIQCFPGEWTLPRFCSMLEALRALSSVAISWQSQGYDTLLLLKGPSGFCAIPVPSSLKDSELASYLGSEGQAFLRCRSPEDLSLALFGFPEDRA